jgi:hypothetical protein
MRMKKAGQQIAAVLDLAGRRWKRVSGPRRGLADAIDTGSKGDISDAYRCDTPNVFRK